MYPSMHWPGGVMYPSMHLAGGCVSAQGDVLSGGVCPWSCLPRGVGPVGCLPLVLGGVSAQDGGCGRHPSCGQNDRQV